MEQEQFLLAEVASHPPIPLTEGQETKLAPFDHYIEKWVTDMELEKTRRRLSDEYQKRTIPGL